MTKLVPILGVPQQSIEEAKSLTLPIHQPGYRLPDYSYFVQDKENWKLAFEWYNKFFSPPLHMGCKHCFWKVKYLLQRVKEDNAIEGIDCEVKAVLTWMP